MIRQTPRLAVLFPTAIALALLGCGDAGRPPRDTIGATGGNTGTGGSAGVPVLTQGGNFNSGGAGPAGGANCGTANAKAELKTEPVDIILVVDNSGSMDDELASVEANINNQFGDILVAANVDYRVIAISRHRTDTNTSLCVTQPMSTLATCPAPAPGISDRFKQFNTKIESDDSFDHILDAYIAPFGGPCLSLCDNGATSESDGDDNSKNTAIGYSEWLRPGAKKVFLEITDDNEDMPVDTFLTELTRIAPEFGTVATPNFIFHSIVGLAPKASPADAYAPTEPIQTSRCPNVTTAGETYQALSIRTGGLRFPVCSFANYGVVFNRIAQDVIVSVQLACDFAIPTAPDGRQIEPNKIAVTYSSDGAVVANYGQVLDPANCQPDAFYIQNGRVFLCPDACTTVSADTKASVDVLFTCESTIILQ